ncbi:MAG: hypothetical protein ACREL9_04085 [Gemmatimonadales bacterium]
MARVELATPAMFDAIYPLLQELNPRVSQERWRLLVDYRWRSADEPMGYVLVEKQNIVGFIGTLVSRRIIDGKEVRLCNTTNWVVKEEFRAESLSLFMAVMKLRDCTLTNLTSSMKVSALMIKLGFKHLESSVRLLFPVPVLPGLAGRDRPVFVSDHGAIAETLRGTDLKIFRDHSGWDCGHLVVQARGEGADEYCYLVFKTRRKRVLGRDIHLCHIHYISNLRLFLRHLSRIRLYFFKTFGLWLLAVDERLIGHRPVAFSKAHRLRAPRYFRSDVLAADQIDNLYTELVVGS